MAELSGIIELLSIFSSSLRNTLVIAISAVFLTVISSSLVAYSFSRLRWHGRDILFFRHAFDDDAALPGYDDTAFHHVQESRLGQYTSAADRAPCIRRSVSSSFLLRQFFLSLPRDLDDAAIIDGCSEFGVPVAGHTSTGKTGSGHGSAFSISG